MLAETPLIEEIRFYSHEGLCPIEVRRMALAKKLLEVEDETLIAEVERILRNLVTNALKYSAPETDVEVTVVKEEDEAHFRVRDYGIGIPAEALPRLFEPFYRAGNVGAVYGTGLGLAIVRQAVERLGGRVVVQSKVGAGTVFHVWLPVGSEEKGEG